jgi:ribosome assembly protein YihI (activator of Der GTPase)
MDVDVDLETKHTGSRCHSGYRSRRSRSRSHSGHRSRSRHSGHRVTHFKY